MRKVNVDQDRALADHYGVQGIPCFLMVVNGKEVDRVVGATDHGRLEAMFHRNGVEPGGGSNVAHGAHRGLLEDPTPVAFPGPISQSAPIRKWRQKWRSAVVGLIHKLRRRARFVIRSLNSRQCAIAD